MFSDPAPEADSQNFHHYKLLEEIGQDGAMGSVYRARQVKSERIVALKMLPAERLRSAEMVQRFHIEVKAAANLNHPYVLPVYEVGEHQGQHYYTMRLAEAGSLGRQMDKGLWKLPKENRRASEAMQRRIAELIQKVAEGVQHAHERGVLHRDLKPGNILLDHDGTPYVSDFGLAKQLQDDSELTRTKGLLGTPAYMAPEQAVAGGRDVSARSDVWALGVILYELLAGKLPFQGENLFVLLDQIRNSEPAPPNRENDQISVDLQVICLRCLEKDPARRIASAGELAAELGRFLDHRPIRSRPIGPAEQLWKWCVRNRTLASVGTGLILVGLSWLVSEVIRFSTARRENRILSLQSADTALGENRLEGMSTLLKRLQEVPSDAHALERLQSALRYRLWMTPVFRTQISGGKIYAIEPDPQGKWCAILSKGGIIHIHASDQARELTRIETGMGLTGLRVLSDSSGLIAFGDSSNLVCYQRTSETRWDLAWKTNIGTGIGFCSLVGPRGFVLGQQDGTVTRFESVPMQTRWKVGTLHADRVTAGTVDPSGRYFASGDASGGLVVQDLENGKILARSSLQTVGDPEVNDLQFSADGLHLIVGCEAPQLVHWNWGKNVVSATPVDDPIRKITATATNAWFLCTATGTLYRGVAAAPGQLSLHEVGIRTGGPPVALRAAGGVVALLYNSGDLEVLDAETGRPRSETIHLTPGSLGMALKGNPVRLFTGPTPERKTNGILTALALEQPIATHSTTIRRTASPTNVNCVAISSDGRWEASGAEDGSAWVRRSGDSGAGHTFTLDGPVQSLVFFTRPDRLLIGSYSNRSRLVSLDSETLTSVPFGPTNGVWGLRKVVSPPGVMTLSRRGESSSELEGEFWGIGNPEKGQAFKVRNKQGKMVTPPIDAIATAEWDSTVVGIDLSRLFWWDAASPTNPATMNRSSSPLHCCALDPTGTYALVGCADGMLFMWKKGIEEPVLSEQMAPVTAVAMSPQGLTGYAGLSDGRVYQIRLGESPRLAGRLRGIITDIALNRDGAVFAASSSRGNVKAWSAEYCLPLSETWEHSGRVDSVFLSQDASVLLAACRDGGTRRYQVRWGREAKFPSGVIETLGIEQEASVGFWTLRRRSP